MKLLTALLLACTLPTLAQPATAPKKAPPAVSAEDDYKPGPDSQRQAGVPMGKTFSFKFDQSKIFPGTSRTITVYVPAEYTADKPACVFINLDGIGFGAQTVFDNLIHKNEMPVTIAVGISPGQVESVSPPSDPRFNRSFEFDGLNDSLARCVLEEILPEVEKQKTPDGLAILLSKDGNDRCVAGGSTGAIAAFTLAWERPDAFRRVFSAIGTYVGMRGGDRYPVLVRKTEPKPLRIFMQDGSNDQWGGGPEVGDWWMSNQTLERALSFSGYQVEHAWGTGFHSGRHSAAIFPDAMRYLWKDWPQPIKAGQTQNTFLKAILAPGEEWQVAASGYQSPGALAANGGGEVFLRDVAAQKTLKLTADTRADEIAAIKDQGEGMAFGPDGRLFVTDTASAQIKSYDTRDVAGKSTVLAEGIRANRITVAADGRVYATESDALGPSKVWLVSATGEKTLVDEGLNHATGLALSPDGLWLAVVESKTHVGYSYRVRADGKLEHKQKFYWLHVPDSADDSGAAALCFDRDGRLYAATRMGVQVLDRNGRVRAILPVPGGEATSVCFGGKTFDTLYVTAGGKVYQRKVKSIGAPAWAAPIKLPPWGAG